MSRIPKSGVKKTEEVVGAMEARNEPPAGEGLIATVINGASKILGLRDSNRRPCQNCDKPEARVFCSANNTGAFKTYYYCDNRQKTGCKFAYSVVHPNVQEKLKRQAKGEHVKTPVKDHGNYGGLERIE